MARTEKTRQTLTRSRVLASAIELADTEGIDAVSMRNLADRLGVVPMALYKHVADKEDLLDGMVDTLIRATPAPAPAAPQQWPGAVRDTILAVRVVVQQHPWARRALETRTVRTPAVLGHMERLTQLFLRGGLSPDLVHHVMHALGNRIWGFSPELFNEPESVPGEQRKPRRHTFEAPDPADYPGILAIAADSAARRPGATGCDEEFEFRFALDLLLGAIQRLHEEGWDSTVSSKELEGDRGRGRRGDTGALSADRPAAGT